MYALDFTASSYEQSIKRSIRDTWRTKRTGKGAMTADEFVEWYWGKYGMPREWIKYEVEREG